MKREPNGRVQRGTRAEPATLMEGLEQRSAAVAALRRPGDAAPLPPVQAMLDSRAGTALGKLRLADRIDEREYRAGEALAALWRRWAALAQCPPRTPRHGDHGSATGEADVERWERADRRMREIKARVWAEAPHPVLAWSMLESICMDDVVPPRLVGREPWPVGWASLRDGFAAVARCFRIPEGQRVRELETVG